MWFRPGGAGSPGLYAFAIVGALILIAGVQPMAAHAEPGLEGVTGILNVPSAEAAKDGEVFAGFGRNENNLRFPGRTQRNYFLGVGFLPGLEISARYIDFPEIQDPSVPGFGTRKDRSVNVKFQLLDERSFPASFAIGVYDVGGGAAIERGKYAAVSKTVGAAKLTAGYGNDRFDGFFGGVEVAAADELDLLYEYDSHSHNFGVRVNPHPDWHLTLASVSNGFNFGVSYTKTLTGNRNPKEEVPVQPVERMPLAAGTSAEELDQLAGKLAATGLDNVMLKAAGDELAVKYENRRFRHDEDAWAFVCLWAAAYAPETVEKLRIVSRREGYYTITTEYSRDDLLDYVNGECTAAELAAKAVIRDYRGPGYEFDTTSGLFRPAAGGTDLYFTIANTVDLGQPNTPVKQRTGLGVKHETVLADHFTFTGYEEIPISNNLDNRDSPFAVRETLNYYSAREGGLYGFASGGYFGGHRWGGRAEVRKYFDESRFDLGVSSGYVKNLALDDWQDELLFSASARLPRYDMSLTGYTGKFITGDEGYLLSAGRYFGGHEISFFYYNTDYTGNEAGVRFSLPVPGYPSHRASRLRAGVTPDYIYEYRTMGGYAASFLDPSRSVDQYRARLYPWHLRENLYLLRVAAGREGLGWVD
jgi:hypothetical protein